jgi:DNA polymerase-3 subunit gamma/tau
MYVDSQRMKPMSIKSIALATTAFFVLTAGASVVQADPQDERVRQLNLEQLAKAQAARGTATTGQPATMPATETTTPDGQGGPEFQGPPKPDEGMTDEDDTTKPAEDTPDQPATAPPPTDAPEPPTTTPPAQPN